VTLVLLDVDGTLVDLAPPPTELAALREQLVELAQRHAVPVTHRGTLRVYGALAAAGSGLAAGKLIDSFEVRWAEHAVPLVDPTVWAGLTGVRTALVTSNGRACIDVLRRRGLLGDPDVVVTRNDSAALKPDPEPLRLALALAAADTCAGPVPFLGDSPADRAAADAWSRAGGRPPARFVATRDISAEQFLIDLTRRVHQ
jgi:beta-phosphoglucomutase-like phosphatase (HAD superfamily)